MPSHGPLPDPNSFKLSTPEERANAALQLMERALELLDEDDPANVAGAHLDLAIHRLRDSFDRSGFRLLR